MTSAVVFVPTEHIELFASQCLTYCAARGYQVVGVIRGDWGQVLGILRAGLAGVVVVARPEHLDPQREPRVEIATTPRPGAHNQRRTARVSRRGVEA